MPSIKSQAGKLLKAVPDTLDFDVHFDSLADGITDDCRTVGSIEQLLCLDIQY
jgi:hypothetical protein